MTNPVTTPLMSSQDFHNRMTDAVETLMEMSGTRRGTEAVRLRGKAIAVSKAASAWSTLAAFATPHFGPQEESEGRLIALYSIFARLIANEERIGQGANKEGFGLVLDYLRGTGYRPGVDHLTGLDN